MSQPENTTQASGAEALMAAATRTGRKTRHVPTPKAGAPKAGTEQAPEAAPEVASEAPKVPAEGQDTNTTAPPPQADAEPPKNGTGDAPPEGSKGDHAHQDDPPAGEKAGEAAASGGEVAFPQAPIDYNQLFAPKPKPPLDPAVLTMLRERQTKVVKSLVNIMNMFADRQREYAEAVDYASKLGMPREEMMKIAVAHDCAPFLTALLHNQEGAQP